MLRQPLPALQRRTFAHTPARKLKEDADRSADEVEKKKHESVDKAKRGEGEWHESLASAGESNIAADKHDVEDHDKHMEDLQKETANKSENGEI